MVIITRSYWPPESAMEVGKRFLKAEEPPGYFTRHGPYCTSDTPEGINSIVVYELDNSKLADGLLYLGDFYTAFYDIPGFSFSIRPYHGIEESMKMVGLA